MLADSVLWKQRRRSRGSHLGRSCALHVLQRCGPILRYHIFFFFFFYPSARMNDHSLAVLDDAGFFINITNYAANPSGGILNIGYVGWPSWNGNLSGISDCHSQKEHIDGRTQITASIMIYTSDRFAMRSDILFAAVGLPECRNCHTLRNNPCIYSKQLLR